MSLIEVNTDRCISLISTFKQLNVYQKPEAKSDSNLAEVLESIPSLFQQDGKKIQIEVSHPDHLMARVDPELLTLVIGNLISNAYTHGFGQADEGCIQVIGKTIDNNVQIEVKDNGKGIDSDTLEKAFEPFFTTKRNQGSIGLGLHIVYIVVTQALKGDVNIESQVESGTCVTMTFKKP